ncbi:MAG: hypothetical protein CBC72_002630 [Gammaproteobacteria bacterium TMED112]|nr:MAG: hypothetical protein CBC72_002630 [Gammaproteobacteria bacterium TMED112]|tara:strand:+ start:188 stop:448 length:261 start_codon:yes stop_codon:yes gene_type:complete
MYRLLILLLPMLLNAQDLQDQKISEISVEDLTNIVRMVVQETLAYCMVTGEMQGRARLNLDVEGEVIARLECDFKEPAVIEETIEE